MLSLRPITPETLGFEGLLTASQSEGHRMVLRFAEGWIAGTSRFDRPGERITGAWRGERLVGMCGRNVDPYDTAPRAGRVRHLYVLGDARGAGVGASLLRAIVDGAENWFDYLSTNAPSAAFPFYERMGFVRFEAAHVTHRLTLSPLASPGVGA